MEQKASPAQLQAALDHLVIARPDEFPPELVDRLDQPLRDRNWVPASDTAALGALVQERLATNATLADRLGALRPDADALRADLKDYALPRPRSLNGHPVFFGDPRPVSLYDEFKGRRADIWRNPSRADDRARAAGHSVILRGVGGVGKTTLASEYLFRFGPQHYPGGLFWVNAGVVTDDAVDAQLHAILRQLTPDVPTWQEFKAGGRDVAAELAAELRRPGIQPVLYVIENLPEDRDRLPPLSRWCPAPDAVSLLVHHPDEHELPRPHGDGARRAVAGQRPGHAHHGAGRRPADDRRVGRDHGVGRPSAARPGPAPGDPRVRAARAAPGTGPQPCRQRGHAGGGGGPCRGGGAVSRGGGGIQAFVREPARGRQDRRPADRTPLAGRHTASNCSRLSGPRPPGRGPGSCCPSGLSSPSRGTSTGWRSSPGCTRCWPTTW